MILPVVQKVVQILKLDNICCKQDLAKNRDSTNFGNSDMISFENEVLEVYFKKIIG